MTGTSTGADMTIVTTTKSKIGHALRYRIANLLLTGSLLLTPYAAAPAEDQPRESAISAHARSFGEAVKHDAKAVGDGSKQVAHRVAVAAKAAGHEIATAAKRGAAETRAAFRGMKAKTPPR